MVRSFITKTFMSLFFPLSFWGAIWLLCGTGHIPLKEMPAVQLDTQHMGTDVVIVKNGRRICGTGGCLASAPLHQNKSYFEFKIQSTGIWGIGVATQKVNLNQIPLGRDMHSLVMRNDGALYHNNEEKNRLPANSLPQEGDVVGITYDHVELNVYLNGKNMHCPASGIRGTVYPVVYVDDSAILDCQFSEFYHTPPPGFEKILFEQQIFWMSLFSGLRPLHHHTSAYHVIKLSLIERLEHMLNTELLIVVQGTHVFIIPCWGLV